MLIQTAFSFSSAVQRWVCRFSGLRLHGMRRFPVFLASSPCVASATGYCFRSAVPPRWRSAFSQLVPVAKSKLSVFASGSNILFKPTRILRSASLARSPAKNPLYSAPCFIHRHLPSQAVIRWVFAVCRASPWGAALASSLFSL